MKTNEYIKSTRPAVTTLAVVLLAANTGIATAGNIKETTKSPTRLVELEIELHAPNSSTPTVTVWVPETIPSGAEETPAVGKSGTKEINLPASNSSVSSVTVWAGKRDR